MNYYYDIKVNFQDNNYYFFEWLKTDELTSIKKIPLFLISRNDFLEIYNNHIKLSDVILNLIKEKTILNDGNKLNCILLCDRNNTIVLSFDNQGYETKRSTLSFQDDESICEIIYTVKKTKLEYKSIKKINIYSKIRFIENIKLSIINDLNNLYQSHSYDKLKYYYYEFFLDETSDYKEMLKKLTLLIATTPKEEYKKLLTYK